MSFDNCAQAYAAGRADIPKGDPAYAKKLDRDQDGVACERADAPSNFVPRKSTETGAGTKAGLSDQLPQTGPGEVTALGALVVTLGAVVVLAVRRRRVRFVA